MLKETDKQLTVESVNLNHHKGTRKVAKRSKSINYFPTERLAITFALESVDNELASARERFLEATNNHEKLYVKYRGEQ